MNNASLNARQYLATWSEADSTAHRDQVRQLFTANARYVDPMMQGSSHGGIETRIAGAQLHFPGHRFELSGVPGGHNDVVRCFLGMPAHTPIPRDGSVNVIKLTLDPNGLRRHLLPGG